MHSLCIIKLVILCVFQILAVVGSPVLHLYLHHSTIEHHILSGVWRTILWQWNGKAWLKSQSFRELNCSSYSPVKQFWMQEKISTFYDMHIPFVLQLWQAAFHAGLVEILFVLPYSTVSRTSGDLFVLPYSTVRRTSGDFVCFTILYS